MNKPKAALQLINQMIEVAEHIDRAKEAEDPSHPKGDGFFSFHLKLLRDDLLKDFLESNQDVDT